MDFKPDYRNILSVVQNIRPDRFPLYEHIISRGIMGKIMGSDFADFENGNENNLNVFFANYCKFFQEMTYDTVSYEVPIIAILPAAGASILGREPGPIQCRKDFEAIDWQELFNKYIAFADKKFTALGNAMPEGMKAIGGVANGVFEISEDLVGLEYLAYMQIDDPQLFSDLYKKIGDLMFEIWKWFLEKHGSHYVVCRFGDDLGFRSGTLTSPTVIREHILPQYNRIINLVHDSGYPFLWHSCGCIFDIMDDVIGLGIDAKHSNEDQISPFESWIHKYNDRIGLFGGIDVNLLCQSSPEDVFKIVCEKGRHYRSIAKGYALGSGNSIPDYVPVDNYLAMVKAVQYLRDEESNC